MSLEKNLYFRNIFYFQLLLESPAESEYFIVKYTFFFQVKLRFFLLLGVANRALILPQVSYRMSEKREKASPQ